MMRRLLLALLGLVGVGVSQAQPVLYAQDVLALVMDEAGGVGGDIWLGSGVTFVHPEHSELTISVNASTFRVATIAFAEAEYDLLPNAVLCGIGISESCSSSGGSNLLAINWRMFAHRGTGQTQVGSVCNDPDTPYRARWQRWDNGAASASLCMNWESAGLTAISYVTSGVAGAVATYDLYGGDWTPDFSRSVSCPGCVLPGEQGFSETVWSVVELGVAAYDCEGCTVAGLSDWGVTIEGSYVDGGAVNPDGPGGGDGDGDGGGDGGGFEDGPIDDGSSENCSIINIPCNLRRLFVPSEDWAGKFGSLEWGEKLPFALLDWRPELNCGGGELGPCHVHMANRDEILDDEQSGRLVGGLRLRVPSPLVEGVPVNGHGAGIEYVEFDLTEVPYIDIWHRHVRTWLYWTFVGVFVLNWFKRFVS